MKRKMFLFAVVILLSTTNLFSQLSFEVVWEKPQSGVIDAKFSPDGKFVFCAIGADIKKLDVATGEFIATFDRGTLTQPNQYLELSPDGKWIITLGYLGGVYLWDTQLQKVVSEIKPSGMLENQSLGLASFFPDNKTILITFNTKGILEGEILHYNFIDNKIINRVSSKPVIRQLQTSKDGKYFITGSVYRDWQGNGFCKVTLWDANTLKPIRDYEVPEGNYDGFRKIQLSDNNKLIGYATHSPTNKTVILETETGNVVKTSDVGMKGFNFCFLPNDYYSIYQEADITNYGIYFYLYPDIIQSSMMRFGSGVIISKITFDDHIVIFQVSGVGICLLKNSTTSVQEPTKPEIQIKVEPDKIIISYDHAEIIKIVDLKGNILLDQEVSGSSASISNTFTPGTYICVVKSGDREYSQKFQVVR